MGGPFWNTVARLGEAQILLPALLIVSAWLAWRSAAARTAAWWLALTGLAALITTATKVAFFGWGIGYAPLDFAGLSGHAMFAAAIVPLLVRASFATAAARSRRAALVVGYALAALIAAARVVQGVHSVSEVVLGYALGTLASGGALALTAVPHPRAPRLLLVGLLAWLVATPAGAPPSRTHGWVISLSLALSGRATPYTREMLRRRDRRPLTLPDAAAVPDGGLFPVGANATIPTGQGSRTRADQRCRARSPGARA